MCRDQQLPWFTERAGRDLWRLSVPQVAPVLDLPEPTLVEWHGAQRWIAADRADADALRRVVAAAGGHATLFRAAGAQDVSRFTPPQAPLDRIQRELKQQFDPAGIFNRGRLFPDF
jgi:glycolate oxidase FAD binding subunit